MSLEDVRAIREKKRERRRAQKQVGDVKVSHDRVALNNTMDTHVLFTIGACAITQVQH